MKTQEEFVHAKALYNEKTSLN